MAELKNGLFNGSQGRISNLISYERNGKYFVRTRPTKVRQPNTEKQLIARMRFAMLQPINALLKEVLRYGFATDPQNRPAYSAALSWNLKHAIKGSYPDLSIDFKQLRIFDGDRALPLGISLQNNNGNLSIQWSDSPLETVYHKDRVALILFSSDHHFIDFRLEASRRKDLKLHYYGQLPEGDIHVYISFYTEIPLKGRVTREDVCPSYYCGTWNAGSIQSP